MRTAVIDARVAASLRAFPRVGFIVPRYRHTAVDRNRLKRRLREIVRTMWLPVLPPRDIVLRVTPLAYDKDFDALRHEMTRVLDRLVATP